MLTICHRIWVALLSATYETTVKNPVQDGGKTSSNISLYQSLHPGLAWKTTCSCDTVSWSKNVPRVLEARPACQARALNLKITGKTTSPHSCYQTVASLRLLFYGPKAGKAGETPVRATGRRPPGAPPLAPRARGLPGRPQP